MKLPVGFGVPRRKARPPEQRAHAGGRRSRFGNPRTAREWRRGSPRTVRQWRRGSPHILREWRRGTIPASLFP